MISNTLVEFFFLLIQVYQQQQLDQIDKKRQKKTPRKTTITLTAKNLGLTVTPRISRSVTSLYLLLSLFFIHTLTHSHVPLSIPLSLSLSRTHIHTRSSLSLTLSYHVLLFFDCDLNDNFIRSICFG